jgi:elongator complex protein 1
VGTDSIICAFGPTAQDPLIQLKRWHSTRSGEPHDLEDVASWDAPCPLPDLECDRVLNVRHFSDSSTTCLVLAGGDIVVVRESPSDEEEKIEIVGSVDVGVTAAAWSPDEELLAITTRGDTLLFMTRDFDNISNVTLATEDLKASKHVSVGWGKKETQFKGKGAKALRDPTMPEKVDEGIQSAQDDGSTTISWRGDGAYMAVNSLQASPRRVIRVYSREGLLDGVSEPVDNLEAALSWRPAGNLLAGIQRFEDDINVVFFERNGLRHGEFSLRLSRNEMASGVPAISLKWNIDSSVLAVCFLDRVQLWAMGNYHYYLKQDLHFPTISRSQTPVAVEWHPEQPFNFIVGCEGEFPIDSRIQALIKRQMVLAGFSTCPR